MIQIDDYDPPMIAANKIIYGTRPREKQPVLPLIKNDAANEDMYSISEIEEIALYLMIYVKLHKEE